MLESLGRQAGLLSCHFLDPLAALSFRPLLAVPFVPTHAEYIYLQGRRVLADQMEFLRAHFPRSSPLHQRIALTA